MNDKEKKKQYTAMWLFFHMLFCWCDVGRQSNWRRHIPKKKTYHKNKRPKKNSQAAIDNNDGEKPNKDWLALIDIKYDYGHWLAFTHRRHAGVH